VISLAIAALGLLDIASIALFLNFLPIDLDNFYCNFSRKCVFVFVFLAHTPCFFFFSLVSLCPGGHLGFVHRVFAVMADTYDEDERRRAVYGLFFLFTLARLWMCADWW